VDANKVGSLIAAILVYDSVQAEVYADDCPAATMVDLNFQEGVYQDGEKKSEKMVQTSLVLVYQTCSLERMELMSRTRDKSMVS
jgi:hypothetical protein